MIFSIYGYGAQKNRFIEMVLFSTYNIRFGWVTIFFLLCNNYRPVHWLDQIFSLLVDNKKTTAALTEALKKDDTPLRWVISKIQQSNI